MAVACPSVYAPNMAAPKLTTLEQLKARKEELAKERADEISQIRKNHAERIAALNADERRIRAVDVRNRKKRENHAKILVGVAMIHQCQSSEMAASRFKGLLDEFYADSPERLKEALWGLALIVKKPSSDQEQD